MTSYRDSPYANTGIDPISRFLFGYRRFHPPQEFEVGAIKVPQSPDFISDVIFYNVYVKDPEGGIRHFSAIGDEMRPLIKKIREGLEEMHHKTRLGSHPFINDVIKTPDRT